MHTHLIQRETKYSRFTTPSKKQILNRPCGAFVTRNYLTINKVTGK